MWTPACSWDSTSNTVTSLIARLTRLWPKQKHDWVKLTFNPWTCASELKSTLDMKKPVAYSLPPLSAKPKQGAALRGRTRRMARTRLSPDAAAARPDPDVVVDAVDVAYIVVLWIERKKERKYDFLNFFFFF